MIRKYVGLLIFHFWYLLFRSRYDVRGRGFIDFKENGRQTSANVCIVLVKNPLADSSSSEKCSSPQIYPSLFISILDHISKFFQASTYYFSGVLRHQYCCIMSFFFLHKTQDWNLHLFKHWIRLSIFGLIFQWGQERTGRESRLCKA